jgi:hypothetical protein
VLLDRATQLSQAAEEIKSTLTSKLIQNIIDHIPLDWLEDDSNEMTPSEMRNAYMEFLNTRIKHIGILAKEAEDAR